MRGILAAIFFCLLAVVPAQARQAHQTSPGADEYYSGPGAMPVYRYAQQEKKVLRHATNARRMDRMPVTRHQVAHEEVNSKQASPIEHVGHGLVTVATAARIPITVAAAVASKFQDLIADLVEHGYMPKDIGCFARGGHIRRSFHYRGLACDIDQDARNVTARFMHSKEAHALIREHGLDDGCDFGDCGHVSYGEIGGGRHYVRRYAVHHRHHYAGA